MIDGEARSHQVGSENLNSDIDTVSAKAARLANLKNVMIDRMTKQNLSMDFQSNLRNIFLTWRDYSRRNIRLANAIKSVMQKSLQHKGFEQIR